LIELETPYEKDGSRAEEDTLLEAIKVMNLVMRASELMSDGACLATKPLVTKLHEESFVDRVSAP
jgi:hypothetical protein